MDGATDDFFERLYEQLGEQSEDRTEALKMAGTVIHEIFSWAVNEVNLNDARALEQIGRRILCATVVIDRTILPGSPSLAEVARRLGITSPALSPFCADFRRKFSFTSIGQKHDWRSQKYRKEKPIEQPATN